MNPDGLQPLKDETRACPVCGARHALPYLQKGEVRLVRCGDCAMVYRDPVEPELATGAFYDRLATPFYLSSDKLESDYAPVRFERELRIFRRHCRGGRVLDVGCSTGAFLWQLRTRWPEVYSLWGTDVASAALDHAETRGISVIRESFLAFDFAETRFDAITYWAVIEHLIEPKRWLRKAAGILRAGGVCFVLVPNLRSLAVRLCGARYRYIMPDHVNYFSAATLRALTATAPMLEIVEVRSTHFNPLVIWQDRRGGETRVPDAERARLLKQTTAWKENPRLKPLLWAYAGVERLLGRLRLADNLVMVLRKR